MTEELKISLLRWFDADQWRQEVAEHNTVLGHKEWAEHKLEALSHGLFRFGYTAPYVLAFDGGYEEYNYSTEALLAFYAAVDSGKWKSVRLLDSVNHLILAQEPQDPPITWVVSEDRKKLFLRVDPVGGAALRWQRLTDPNWGSLTYEADMLAQMIANSELDWVNPQDTGDLTDAPMLGLYGPTDTKKTGAYGDRWSGADGINDYYDPILERWAFMDYQVRSFMDDLADRGVATFVSEC